MVRGAGVGVSRGGSEPTCQGLGQQGEQVREAGRAQNSQVNGETAQFSHTGCHGRALPGQGGTLFPHTSPSDYLCWLPFADRDKDIFGRG